MEARVWVRCDGVARPHMLLIFLLLLLLLLMMMRRDIKCGGTAGMGTLRWCGTASPVEAEPGPAAPRGGREGLRTTVGRNSQNGANSDDDKL